MNRPTHVEEEEEDRGVTLSSVASAVGTGIMWLASEVQSTFAEEPEVLPVPPPPISLGDTTAWSDFVAPPPPVRPDKQNDESKPQSVLLSEERVSPFPYDETLVGKVSLYSGDMTALDVDCLMLFTTSYFDSADGPAGMYR